MSSFRPRVGSLGHVVKVLLLFSSLLGLSGAEYKSTLAGLGLAAQALNRVDVLGGVVWDPATGETGRVRPLGRALVLPRPEDPSNTLVFVRLLSPGISTNFPHAPASLCFSQKRMDTYSLDIPELTEEALELVREGRTVSGLVPTVADE